MFFICKSRTYYTHYPKFVTFSFADNWLMFFFFQAEDGIRDSSVTGVQTCALPILGMEVELLSPSPLHCYRRSIKSGWQTVALAQTAKVPLSRASGCRAVPRQVSGRARSDA